MEFELLHVVFVSEGQVVIDPFDVQSPHGDVDVGDSGHDLDLVLVDAPMSRSLYRSVLVFGRLMFRASQADLPPSPLVSSKMTVLTFSSSVISCRTLHAPTELNGCQSHLPTEHWSSACLRIHSCRSYSIIRMVE